MHLFIILFLTLYSTPTHSLSWTDICILSTRTCYIWNDNPAPFNDLSTLITGPVCANGCTLFLSPYSGTCLDPVSCSLPNASLPFTTFILPRLSISQNAISISSLDPATNVNIQQDNCPALTISGNSVSLSGLSFTGTTCITDPVYYSNAATVIYTGGGSVTLSNLNSLSSYTVVLFVSSYLLNLTIANVVFSDLVVVNTTTLAQYPVILLATRNTTITCSAEQNNLLAQSVFFLGSTWPIVNLLTNPIPDPCLLNITLIAGNITPSFPTCPPTRIIQLEENCPNTAIFPVLLTLLSVTIAASIIPLFFSYIEKIQRKLHSSVVASGNVKLD